MARHSPNAPCPCGRDLKLKRCCGRYHRGLPAPDPESLMRSRYTAYALGEAEYILATTHPDGPHFEADRAAWLAQVRRFSREMSFEGLTVHGAREEGDRGMVDFEARMRQGGQEVVLAERSLFVREGGRWLYHSGAVRGG